MAHKKFRNTKLHSKHNLKTEAQAYFIQNFNELFFYKTLNSYQYKMHNSFTLIRELSSAVNNLQANDISLLHIETISSELRTSLQNDKFISKYYPRLKQLLEKIKTNKIKKEYKNTILKIKYNLDLASEYINKDINSLNEYIFKELEAAIKNSDFDNISYYMKILIANLLSEEMHPRSLSSKFYSIFLNYDDTISFENKYYEFKSFILNNEIEDTSEYLFYIELVSNHDEVSHENIRSSEEIIKKLNATDRNKKQIKKGYYWCKNIIGYKENIYKSVLDSLIELEQELSIHSFNNRTIRINRNNIILLEKSSNKSIIVKELFTNNSNKARNLIVDDYKQMSCKINQVNKEDKERIHSALRNYSIGSSSFSPETTLLMYWSSLESILKIGIYPTHVDHIINIIPKLLSINYYERILDDLVEDFVRINIIKVSFQEQEINLKTIQKENGLQAMLRNNSFVECLKNQINDYTLLKHRLENISSVLSDKKTQEKRVKEHHDHIYQHLLRIYRLRNDIIHSAKSDKYISILCEHLDYYNREILSHILNNLKKLKTSSLGMEFAEIENEYDYYLTSLKN